MCNRRLCTLTIKGKFFDTSLISVHALTAQKEEESKDVENDWKIIKETTMEAAENVLDKRERQQRKPWYDNECREVVENRNRARMKMINCGMRANTEEYKEARREVKRTCRRKKRDFERV
jgi:hypothetical protein